jgi:hypothetical protein
MPHIELEEREIVYEILSRIFHEEENVKFTLQQT